MELRLVLVLVVSLIAGVVPKAEANTEHRFQRSHQPKSRFLIVKRNSGSSYDNGDEVPDVAVEDNKPVDLHNKEFCVDVSAFKPLEWVEKEGEECKTEFVKTCEEKRQNVCADVVETKCEVVAYTECSMGMVEQTATETKLAPKLFVEKTCNQGTKTVPHIKMVPQCKNVTKQNCVTLWERDEQGNQIWAGKEGCEPVTWQECKLVPKEVNFIVPEVTCVPKEELWYHEPEPSNFTQMTNTFTCQVKNTTSCVTKPRADCKYIKWNECREDPVTTCNPKLVHVPMQEKVHRKKCLLPDNDIKPSYGPPPPPAPAPQTPKYSPPAPQKPQYAAPPASSVQLRAPKQFQQPSRFTGSG